MTRGVILAAILPLALLGCGWHPLYADRQSAPASAELRAIHVEPISDRVGQRLEIALRDALDPTGGGGPTRYDLRTQLTVSRSDFGAQSQGVATRGRVDITANLRWPI